VTITAEHREKREHTCDGCTSSLERRVFASAGIATQDPVLAAFTLAGLDFAAHLCTDCAVKVIQALAAVVTMRDPRAARELRRFFGVGKTRRA